MCGDDLPRRFDEGGGGEGRSFGMSSIPHTASLNHLTHKKMRGLVNVPNPVGISILSARQWD